jgi:hypothetical protein
MAVIKGRIRGGGRQLAAYLLSVTENDDIRILDVDGQAKFTEEDFRNLLGDFSLNERMTKSNKGIYHASYNPPEELAARLSDEQWLEAANILAEQLAFDNQRRAVVLQKNKSGRYHIHIAYERYSHETGKMIPIPHNYRKHDKARAILEEKFGERPTDRVNPRRVEMKEELTTLWNSTVDGSGFIKAAKEHGYFIALGHEKGQHVFVDNTGRSFKLSSHLKGIRVREVRDRFKGRNLISERDAVAFVKTQSAITAEQINPVPKLSFAENLANIRLKNRTHKPRM